MALLVPDPWQCPACKTWIRGDVAEHRCPPDGGVTAKVPPSGGGGAGGPGPATVSVTATPHAYWATSGTITSGATSIPIHVHVDGKEIYREVTRQAMLYGSRGGGRLRAV